MPDEPEVQALLALMLLHDARREARFRGGELVLLDDQDHALWDAAQIDEGRAVLDRALALRGRGPYVVQAAIASLHADQPRDWPQIAALYGELSRPDRLAGGGAEPSGGGGRGGGPEAGLPSPIGWPWTTTATCTRPAASCCGGWAATTRPAPPSCGRWSWRTTTPSGGCWSGAWPSWPSVARSGNAAGRFRQLTA